MKDLIQKKRWIFFNLTKIVIMFFDFQFLILGLVVTKFVVLGLGKMIFEILNFKFLWVIFNPNGLNLTHFIFKEKLILRILIVMKIRCQFRSLFI